MQSIVHLAAVAVVLVGGCGGGADDDIAAELAALPGVEVAEVFPAAPLPGARYFDLWFDQPVDHAAPGGARLRQYAALVHVDADAPMVVYTSGYGAGRLRERGEVAALVGGNQLSIEYRYYRGAVPAAPDWGFLDVTQASADLHHDVELLRPLYAGAWLATGGSKGGETALHSRYLYPDDYDGAVAYVTPVRTGNPDLRYQGMLDRIGEPTCRARLRAVARELLVRRDVMVARAAAAGSFTVLGADYATEIAIVELEWSFWQYRGEAACGAVPDATADDATLGGFLDETSPPTGYDDATLADSYGAFTYQAMTQLGYPWFDRDHLQDLLRYDYQDLRPFLPAGVDGDALAFDPSFVQGLLAWAAGAAERVVIVDGEWDPWSGGAVPLPTDATRDTRRFVVPRGSHASRIADLPAEEQAAAWAALARWTGVAVPASGGP